MPYVGKGYRTFIDTTMVTLGTIINDADIRYTLDGSDPLITSAEYDGPIHIESNTLIKARVFDNGREGALFQVNLQEAEMHPGVQKKGLKPGLKYRYYEGEWEKLPDFSTLVPL